MSGIRDKEQIDELRRRLYERGAAPESKPDYALKDTPVPVSNNWSVKPPSPPPPAASDPRPEALVKPDLEVIAPSMTTKKRFPYRAIILLVTTGLFLLVLIGTSLYQFLGANQISNKNIGINITGPLTIGGGEVMPLQITVTNQNKVPIESAVLIVSYPPGTKSADDTARDIFEERLTLDRINAGEAINVPARAVVFGEENQELEIRATIEYRLIDSNGTFYKEADPLKFKISSSPLVLRVESIEKVSAGQETEINLTLQSNSPNVLKDVLVSANYPANFNFTSSEPSPMYRESEWLIEEIKPEESVTIKIIGQVSGEQNEEFQMQFSAGTPRQDNQFILGAALANATADFVIEKPFINVDLSINGTESETVTLKTGDQTRVSIDVTNTLTETLYDMAVEVSISGNTLSREAVVANGGYYDSVKDVIRYEVSGNRDLTEINPGQTKTFQFTLSPNDTKKTPAFMVTANAYARRVSEDRVTEALVGTAKSEVKYASSVSVDRQINRNSSIFSDTGPVPPVADQKTTYTITLKASAGGNDTDGVSVSTSIPQYASWEDKTTGDGRLEFNPVTKEITWTAGDIDAGEDKETSFQISIIPSQNQIGTVPAVLGAQRLRATDSFTGTIVRAEGLPLSATLSEEAGFEEDSGEVRREMIESEDD